MIKVTIVQEVDVDPRTVAVVGAQLLEWLEGLGFRLDATGAPRDIEDATYAELAARFAAENDGKTL